MSSRLSDALRFERHELLMLKSDIAAAIYALKNDPAWSAVISPTGPSVGDLLTRSHERVKQLLARVEGER